MSEQPLFSAPPDAAGLSSVALLVDLSRAFGAQGVATELEDDLLTVYFGNGGGFTVGLDSVAAVVAHLPDGSQAQAWDTWRTRTVRSVLTHLDLPERRLGSGPVRRELVQTPVPPEDVVEAELRLGVYGLVTRPDPRLAAAVELGVLTEGVGVKLLAERDGQVLPVSATVAERLGGLDAVWERGQLNLELFDPAVDGFGDSRTQIRVLRGAQVAGYLGHPAAALTFLVDRGLIEIAGMRTDEFFVAAPSGSRFFLDVHPDPLLLDALQQMGQQVATEYFALAGTGDEVSPHVYVQRRGRLTVVVRGSRSTTGVVTAELDRALVPLPPPVVLPPVVLPSAEPAYDYPLPAPSPVHESPEFSDEETGLSEEDPRARLSSELRLQVRHSESHPATAFGTRRLLDDVSVRLVRHREDEPPVPVTPEDLAAVGGEDAAWDIAEENLPSLALQVEGTDDGEPYIRRMTAPDLAGAFLASPDHAIRTLQAARLLDEELLRVSAIFVAAPSVDEFYLAVLDGPAESEALLVPLLQLANDVAQRYQDAAALGRQVNPRVWVLRGNELTWAAVVGDEGPRYNPRALS